MECALDSRLELLEIYILLQEGFDSQSPAADSGCQKC